MDERRPKVEEIEILEPRLIEHPPEKKASIPPPPPHLDDRAFVVPPQRAPRMPNG